MSLFQMSHFTLYIYTPPLNAYPIKVNFSSALLPVIPLILFDYDVLKNLNQLPPSYFVTFQSNIAL